LPAGDAGDLYDNRGGGWPDGSREPGSVWFDH